jgi:hypothetical protein
MSKYDAYLDWGFGLLFLACKQVPHPIKELGLLNAVGWCSVYHFSRSCNKLWVQYSLQRNELYPFYCSQRRMELPSTRVKRILHTCTVFTCLFDFVLFLNGFFFLLQILRKARASVVVLGFF